MKKRTIVWIGIVCLVVMCFAVSSGVSALTEKSIATIGEYEITERTLKAYSLLLSFHNDSADILEKSVQMYARARIAADDISGTTYDTPKGCQKELLRQAEENFDRYYETEMAFCDQHGITREELIHAVVTSKYNILVEGQHLSMIIDQYMEKERASGIKREYTAEELTEIYENYMTARSRELEFVPLDNEKLQQIASSVSSFRLESMGDMTND